MRKLGIDYGDARIGLAISDPLGMFASGLETYKTVSREKDLQYVANVINQNDVDIFVVGLPLNMDGTEGVRVEKTKEFCTQLKPLIKAEIVYNDERLTTVSAEKMLIESNVRREKRKTVIDKLAACLILQSWLDSHSK